ncbi:MULTISPECIES: glycosyltransferase family 4 protein [unclassified Sutcliffiella]|uniref:glycosyltransferase family 4 protein n=1 Tax=unclassified Sutcliffiella TaxID=2837532 RepID=UPI0030CF1B96
MSKRILLISQNFYPEIGSAANRIKNVYKLLNKQGYSVKVITTVPAYPQKSIYEDEKFWDDSEVKSKDVHRVSVKTRKYSRNIFHRLMYYLEIALKMMLYIFRDKNKYDLIFVTSPAIFVGFVGLIAKYRYRTRMFLDVRDLWPESLKGVGVLDKSIIISIFSYLEKLLYNKSDEIIVNSLGFVEHIRKKTKDKSKNIIFIPNGANLEELYSDIQKDNINVIYAGNIGLAQDFNIIKLLAERLSELNIRLDIIGYGMKVNKLANFVKNNKLKNVSFIKPITRKECLSIISNYYIGIVTLCDKEVFKTVLPGKVIDYMTCGVPIVASVSGISKQVIEEQKTGFVTDSQNIDEMIEGIIRLINEKEMYNQMSRNATRYIEKNFIWEKNINKLIELIEKEPPKRKYIRGFTNNKQMGKV